MKHLITAATLAFVASAASAQDNDVKLQLQWVTQ